MAGVSAIFSLVSCNTPVYSCASVQAPIFLPYNLPVISFKVCSKFISNSILHDSFIFAKMNVPCHTHFFIFFFFVWVLYLFLVSHPLVSAVPGYFLSFLASIPFLPLRPGISCTFWPLYPFSRCALGISYPFWPPYLFCCCALGISCTFRLFIPSQY